jgi:two-component system OmpR family sensor kinase
MGTHEVLRRLRTRLLLWFLAAIVVAAATSASMIWLMRTDWFMPGQAAARTMGPHLAEIWTDEAACDAYVSEMRASTGIDYRLRRHPDKLPHFVHANTIFSDDMRGNFFISVEKDEVLLGAVEYHIAPRGRWWRLAISLLAMGVVLAFAAVFVAGDLARPLERVASAAERLGAGHLRTRVRKPGEKGSSTYEINQVAEAFDTMADKVEQMVQGQRELLGAISHELRSPLGRARIALEIARERMDADPKAAARSISEIDGQLTEVDSILGDLLAVTRAGLTDLQSDTVTLVPWLRGRVAAEAKGGDVELDAEDDMNGRTAKVDAPLLDRALHNLIANARAHGHPADAPLEVSISYADRNAVVAVRDRGPGFSEEILPRAFEPFVRADVARSPRESSQVSSTGLGLALVKRIIEAHGGTVFARNRDGGGAEVGFRLPVGAAVVA